MPGLVGLAYKASSNPPPALTLTPFAPLNKGAPGLNAQQSAGEGASQAGLSQGGEIAKNCALKMELDPTHASTPETLDDALLAFWREQTLEADRFRATREADFKAQNDLPLARIKRIMKSDEDVRMISAEAPVVLARACELFVLELTLRAAKGQENEKVITRADVVAAIKNAATMDFLRGVVDPSMAPSADEIAAAEEEDLY